jgi:chromosome partitioning protein
MMSGKIITVAQQKGGSGKTTVAAHLAVALARRDTVRVALLDVDPQGSLGEWFEARERRLGERGTGMGFRTASGWGARREAMGLARDYDLVVVDTPPKSDLEAKPAIEAASLVVVPIQPTPIDFWSSAATLKIIAREKAPALVILNRVPPKARISDDMIAEIVGLGAPVADARIGNRVAFAASMGLGATVVETEPGSKGALEVEALAREIGLSLADRLAA